MPGVTAGPKEDDLLVGSWFTLELKKATITGISEVSGLAVEMDVVEITQTLPGGITETKKRPGAAKYGEITLKRPLSADKSLWQWAKDIRDGKKDYRADGAVVLYDISNAEVGRWTFTNAWPSKWSASDLDVGSDDPMMEEVTLVIELLVRDK
jgi:phage tail-like protein